MAAALKLQLAEGVPIMSLGFIKAVPIQAILARGPVLIVVLVYLQQDITIFTLIMVSVLGMPLINIGMVIMILRLQSM